jgi:regulator of sigma E protease
MGIIVGILILSVMMIVHELGHFLTGRALGFKIEEFSVFMGPKIYSFERKGILYSLKLLPIGASVRFAGESEENGLPGTDPGWFYNRPKWMRAVVITTGPVLNLLSGIIAFLIMFSTFGYTLPVIAEVIPNTQAASAGLVAGDRIISAAGGPVRTTLDYSGIEMFLGEAKPVDLVVQAPDGKTRNLTISPVYQGYYRLGVTVKSGLVEGGGVIDTVDPKANNGQPVLQQGDIILAANGVSYAETAAFRDTVRATVGKPFTITVLRQGAKIDLTMSAMLYNDLLNRGIYFTSSRAFLPAIGQSFQWSWSIVKVTLKSISHLITGEIKPADTLSGPVGVVNMISNVVTEKQPLSDKIYQLLWMFALISVSLGFMNLLPIPPLDGNHLVLIGLEAVRGKRLSIRSQNMIGFVGFAIIILLALAGLYFDIARIAGV